MNGGRDDLVVVRRPREIAHLIQEVLSPRPLENIDDPGLTCRGERLTANLRPPRGPDALVVVAEELPGPVHRDRLAPY